MSRLCRMRIFLPALCFTLLLMAVPAAYAAEATDQEINCPPGTGQSADNAGICGDPDQVLQPLTQPRTGILQPPLEQQQSISSGSEDETQSRPLRSNPEN